MISLKPFYPSLRKEISSSMVATPTTRTRTADPNTWQKRAFVLWVLVSLVARKVLDMAPVSCLEETKRHGHTSRKSSKALLPRVTESLAVTGLVTTVLVT